MVSMPLSDAQKLKVLLYLEFGRPHTPSYPGSLDGLLSPLVSREAPPSPVLSVPWSVASERLLSARWPVTSYKTKVSRLSDLTTIPSDT